jgi:gliding motility-associated-like protein
VVFGNSEHIQEQIEFKIYESGDPVIVQGDLLAFEVDGTMGNVQVPFIIAEPKLAVETDILNFDLGPGMLDIQIENEEVNVSVDISTSLSTLPVSFELSEGAILSVEGKQWISGEFILNYSTPLKLQVFSEGLFHLKEYTLTVVREHDVIDAHNFISPNGDGYNDFWEISNPDRLANYEFEVRSQEGEVVFRQTGYSIPWDGMYKGNSLPAGTFWYVITNPDTGRKLRGFITLIY